MSTCSVLARSRKSCALACLAIGHPNCIHGGQSCGAARARCQEPGAVDGCHRPSKPRAKGAETARTLRRSLERRAEPCDSARATDQVRVGPVKLGCRSELTGVLGDLAPVFLGR